MRYFIALEIPDECREQIKQVQTSLQQIVPEVRLTNNEKLHLTIAFIGEEPANFTEDLTVVLKEAVSGIPPFQVIPSYIDAFPDLHNPHTFWVGVKGEIDLLFVLRERVKDGLARLGLDVDERRYLPHIAIGKINEHYNLTPKQESALQDLAIEKDFGPIDICSIKLFESVPEMGFHRHNTLAEISLA